MSNLTIFDFNNTDLRVMDVDGNPWFLATDVLKALNMDANQSANYLRFLDSNEQQVIHITLGKGNPNRKFISESGLYKLVMRSDKPEAKTFQNWVAQVVLPAIRKDGAYVVGEEKVASGELSEDELILRVHEILTRKVARLTAERDGLVETVGQCKHTLARFARTLPGVNLNKVKESLFNQGYLYRSQGTGSYRVYSKYRHLFQEKHLDQYGSIELFPTPEGCAVLAGLFSEGKLLMKKGFSRN